VRGEVSPGYTSPSHPYVAERMAAVVPGAWLVYAVRDPIRRAASQYRHHRRDGTEPRELEEALLDPGSQYVARGRYFERLAPFLATGAFDGRIEIVAQEQLHAAGRAAMRRLFGHLGVDDCFWSPDMEKRRNESPDDAPALPARLRDGLSEAFRDDADRLREFAREEFPDWSV
jgi:Sulfotransferase family